MMVLDTCAMVFDALDPRKLSPTAMKAIDKGEQEGCLACSDISLWEIAMLIEKGRLDPAADAVSFIKLTLSARAIRVFPITPEIAALSTSYAGLAHYDPADRLIAATALSCQGAVITCDKNIRKIKGLKVIW